jgi:hypothetical protein
MSRLPARLMPGVDAVAMCDRGGRSTPQPAPSGGPIHLVQLLLPLYDNDGRAFPPAHYAAVRTTLTDRFNGLTAYTRAPAQGLWSESDGPPKRDDIVVYEVMTDTLDRAWWAEFRRSLERRFAQEELVVRALAVERV